MQENVISVRKWTRVLHNAAVGPQGVVCLEAHK
jgi:hypothetical protein